MPYAKKNYRKKTYKRKTYRRSKLADKKINTLIEKRIEEIAKKEDRKNITHYVETRCQPSTLQNNNYVGVSVCDTFSTLIKNNANDITSSLYSVEYVPLTDFGNNYRLNTQPDDAVEKARNQNLDFNITQIQSFVKLYNNGSQPYQVSMALVGIPNANKYTAAAADSSGITRALEPNRAMLTKNNWKFAPTDSGINAGFYLNSAKSTHPGQKYTIFDRKTITVSPSKKGSDENMANPRRVFHCKLGKYFKNPKKLRWTTSSAGIDNRSQLMDNYNMYFLISTDQSSTTSGQNSDINYQFVAGVKFTLGDSTSPKIKASTPL